MLDIPASLSLMSIVLSALLTLASVAAKELESRVAYIGL